MDKDTVKGMLLGHALGDALGAPHEFHHRKVEYTGKLEHNAGRNVMFKGWRQGAIGQTTDDKF